MVAEAPPGTRPDYTIDQNWDAYTAADHATWHTLFRRQEEILKGRAAPEFLEALADLPMAADRIPDFRRLTDMLHPATGWSIVAVPGLVPGDIFFEHLANRRFPVTVWIRTPEQMDYLEEPDLFHDTFGHVPLLMNPVFADFIQAYGRAGQEATRLGCLDYLGRLYWYTVEFGLIRRPEGMRIYGAGIVSSRGESVWCLEDPSPNHIGFDLRRVMRTHYRIDDYQETYFVIDEYDQLFAALERDLQPVYEELKRTTVLEPGGVQPGDTVYRRGTGVYHRARRRAAE
ncbi:phenylalanine 4-monooxygenase [Azospirillum halopraeferens]|uniref:phenylalanine 4-monooxygenase n=1 Tax=Azospirillum halopraeferens TaxID=34010 RepID=UPI000490D51E|nr:phenylalanine 4-monooxygenase [Azospirillum halopraeferens]